MITVDFNRLGVNDGARILDIGCGTGRHLASVAARGRVFVVGADRNTGDLAKARERMTQLSHWINVPGRWRLVSADIRELPFADHCFDIVLCSEVLEHVADDRGAAAEMVRVAKPRGMLAVSVPRHYPEKICWRLSKDYSRSEGGHIRIYTPAALIGQMAAAGAQFAGRHWAHSLHTPFWWLKCFVGLDRNDVLPVMAYRRFLEWDIMNRPVWTQQLDRLLNPLIGKSYVAYFRAPPAGRPHAHPAAAVSRRSA